MNIKLVLNTLGKVILIEVIFLFFPFLVSAIYGETCIVSFIETIGLAMTLGLALVFLCKPKEKNTFVKDGTAIVVLSWIVMSVIGALPFVFSGEIPNFFDAFFETVSGFTTTGASICTNVEKLSHGILFWRSLTHWLGGMGVLVFFLAISPKGQHRTINILKAEMPGPSVDKLMPKAGSTARILYIIYFVLTLIEVVLLWAGDMNLFEALVHTFGTAGTGGFGIKCDGLAGYSAYSQWVITIFMLLFGVNFNFYFLILLGNVKTVLKSNELWVYLGIYAASAAIVAYNVTSMFNTVGEAIRHSCFQVSSILTTTGFATCDFNQWPQLSRTILVLIMFFGGCAGSTAGGIKMSRVVIIFQSMRNNIRSNVRPRSVNKIKLNCKVVDENMERSIMNYLALYVVIHVVAVLLISFEPFDFETNFTAVVSCINNIGPGLGAVGPAGNFSGYTAFSKIVLSFSMLMGRLEILPLVMFLCPDFWSKRSR